MKIKHYHFKTVDSTNTWAKEHASEFNPHSITLVTASEQTAGRGRFKRHWVSPPDMNIYATFCFFVGMDRIDIGNIPQVLALSVAQVLEVLGFQPKLKWPNDILLSEKKMGGILCETVTHHTLRCVICGIGLNVNMPQEILAQIDRPATSLLVEGGQSYSVDKIFQLLNRQFIAQLSQFLREGFPPFYEPFKQRFSLQKDQKIYFNDNQNWIEAYFEEFNSNGSINLRLPDGQVKTFLSGEFI